MTQATKEEVLTAIRQALEKNTGKRLTRKSFLADSGLIVADIFRHWSKWSDALSEAGADFGKYNKKISPDELLRDWGELTRSLKQIPTRNQYKLGGSYSASVFERNFGPWSSIPSAFKEFAKNNSEWDDVLLLLPDKSKKFTKTKSKSVQFLGMSSPSSRTGTWHKKLNERSTYGDPIDFRGLRYEPVNEGGVVFLFGMVAKELGYLVEAVQAGFPDCEAKRQIGRGKWQTVRIEFEYESKNFQEHGHDPNGCDIIICWRRLAGKAFLDHVDEYTLEPMAA